MPAQKGYRSQPLRVAGLLILGAVLGAGGTLALQRFLTPISKPSDIADDRNGSDFLGFPLPKQPAVGPPEGGKKRSEPGARKYQVVGRHSQVGFDASSTLHDFSGWTRAVSGEIEFAREHVEGTARARLVVDARTLKTGNDGRDRDMHQDALHSDRFPEIVFELKEVKGQEPGSPGRIVVTGALTIHGATKSVEAPVTYEIRDDGFLHVHGRLPLKLTDFGIDPPRRIAVLAVRDQITLWFDLWAAPEGKP